MLKIEQMARDFVKTKTKEKFEIKDSLFTI